MSVIDTVLPWIDLILTVGAISIVWKETRYYRLAETAVISGAAGHWTLMGIKTILDVGIAPLTKGVFIILIPLVFGLTFFGRFTKWPWISRYGLAVVIGNGLGLTLRTMVSTTLIVPMQLTLQPLLNYSSASVLINGIIVTILIITSISYFIYTVEPKGTFGKITKIGRYGLMITFGASFAGYTARFVARLIVRVLFVVEMLLGLLP